MSFLLSCTLLISSLSYAKGQTVEDYQGNQLHIEQPASRVIALAPHIVENLFTIGAGSKIVGVVEYSDFPELAKKLTRVGRMNKVSLETIVSLSPDLVVGWTHSFDHELRVLLDKLDIPFYIDNPETLEDVARSLQDLAVLTGLVTQGEQGVKQYLQELGKLRAQYSNRVRLRVFYQVWSDPLQSLNGESLISDVIELCGGDNIFADAKVIAPKVSLESVLARNPELIIASEGTSTRSQGQEQDLQILPRGLQAWRQWSTIAAVKNKQLYNILPDLLQRHTVRILRGTKAMCHALDKARAQT